MACKDNKQYMAAIQNGQFDDFSNTALTRQVGRLHNVALQDRN